MVRIRPYADRPTVSFVRAVASTEWSSGNRFNAVFVRSRTRCRGKCIEASNPQRCDHENVGADRPCVKLVQLPRRDLLVRNS